MEMKDFYFFESPYLSSSFQVESIGLDQEEESLEDHNNLIRAKYEKISFPVLFKQVSGKKLTDLLNTGWPSLYLISDKLENILKENHFTGWKTYPIILKDKKINLIEGYQGFSITGISGSLNYLNSPIIETRYVPEGPIVRLYKGANIDLSKWDKSDFFVPEKTTEIIVTKKVVETLEKNKVTNLKFINVAEIEVPTFVFERINKKE